jgi:hypothetical protein
MRGCIYKSLTVPVCFLTVTDDLHAVAALKKSWQNETWTVPAGELLSWPHIWSMRLCVVDWLVVTGRDINTQPLGTWTCRLVQWCWVRNGLPVNDDRPAKVTMTREQLVLSFWGRVFYFSFFIYIIICDFHALTSQDAIKHVNHTPTATSNAISQHAEPVCTCAASHHQDQQATGKNKSEISYTALQTTRSNSLSNFLRYM